VILREEKFLRLGTTVTIQRKLIVISMVHIKLGAKNKITPITCMEMYLFIIEYAQTHLIKRFHLPQVIDSKCSVHKVNVLWSTQ
jgi:hypothetical protein